MSEKLLQTNIALNVQDKERNTYFFWMCMHVRRKKPSEHFLRKRKRLCEAEDRKIIIDITEEEEEY